MTSSTGGFTVCLLTVTSPTDLTVSENRRAPVFCFFLSAVSQMDSAQHNSYIINCQITAETQVYMSVLLFVNINELFKHVFYYNLTSLL